MCCDFLLKYFPFYSVFCVLGGCQGCGFINIQRRKAFNRICWVKQEWSTIANLLLDPKHVIKPENKQDFSNFQHTEDVYGLRLAACTTREKKKKAVRAHRRNIIVDDVCSLDMQTFLCLCLFPYNVWVTAAVKPWINARSHWKQSRCSTYHFYLSCINTQLSHICT